MSATSTLRGHPIILTDVWRYSDTMEPTAGNPRDCGHCGNADTTEGHDGCLGELPGVMNACCGHGDDECAYVQYEDGRRLGGPEALAAIADGVVEVNSGAC